MAVYHGQIMANVYNWKFASLKYNNKHSFLDKNRNLNVVDHKYHLTVINNSRPSVFNDKISHDQALRVVMKLALRVIF